MIVVTFNSAATIEECLEACIDHGDPIGEIIIVDNASSDDTVARVRALALGRPVQLIQSERNLGYSAGANVGIRASQSEHLLLLNPDAMIWPGTLRRLAVRFEDPQVGAVGPVSNACAGDQYVGFHLPQDARSGLSHDELRIRLQVEMAGRTMLTKLLIGFCLLLRRSVLDKVGLLDEALFLGSDDLDLSWRLTMNGYRLAIARDVYVEHRSGTSFKSLPPKRVQQLLNQSSLAMHQKLMRFYGAGNVPSSSELWGIEILPTRESLGFSDEPE
ncbi:MAG: glycosyltransferase family 2 protein [Fimbriimonadaceae bacterium]|nr:glycosyltransferase family 2 protein [Fimbriimonadaceae bacterium]